MKIVSLVPSITETLFELGVGDSIVGITRYCILPREAVRGKTRVGGTKNPDLDQIVNLKPDVVIVNMEENRKEDAEYLQQQGLHLMITYPESLEASIETVEQLGKAFGAEQKAQAMTTEMRSLMSSTAVRQTRRTLVLIWKNPTMTVSGKTYVDAICRHFGFASLFAHSAELYPSITDEDILRADPEVVLFPDEPYPFRPRDVEEFRTHFTSLRAVKANRLLLLNGIYLTWHSFGTLRALRELPEVFGTMK